MKTQHLGFSWVAIVGVLVLVACKTPVQSDSSEFAQNNSCRSHAHSNSPSVVDALSTGSLSLQTCAILNGAVKCWGVNDSGQLGLGDTNSRGDDKHEMGQCLPDVNLGSKLVSSVAVSNNSNFCALFTDGSIKCWGLNSFGELGLENTTNQINPSQMGQNLAEINLGIGNTAKSIVAGDRYFCAHLQNDLVKCWGAFTNLAYSPLNPGFVGDQVGEMGDNLPYINIPAGRSVKKLSSSCAILDDNSLYCWKKVCNSDSGNHNGPTFTCTDMANNYWIPVGQVPTGGVTKEISQGVAFMCAIIDNGVVKCWGANDFGQLGQGDTINKGYNNSLVNDIANLPAIDLGTNRYAKKISTGLRHACALLDDDSVKCWGHNEYGQLGLEDTQDRGDNPNEMGDNLPAINLGTGRTAIDISVAGYHSCAILDDRSVKCWGANSMGNLGQENTDPIGAIINTMGDALKAISLW